MRNRIGFLWEESTFWWTNCPQGQKADVKQHTAAPGPIWLRQILKHHTDAISTVFVERILVQQQLKIPYFQKKNTFYLKLLTALKQFTKTAFCLGGNKVTHCRSIFKKKTYFIKIPNFQKTLYLKQFRFSETLFFSKYHIPATTRLLCCLHCSINHAENFCNIIFKIAVLLGN